MPASVTAACTVCLVVKLLHWFWHTLYERTTVRGDIFDVDIHLELGFGASHFKDAVFVEGIV